MSANSRFTVALHILTWMALVARQREIVTSDQIAASVNTNPVFIRRILGLLEKAHLVIVQHGTGAGWKMARTPEAISLLDIYQAVEQAPLFEMHHSQPNQACPVGRGIQPALKGFYEDAESALKQHLAQVTVTDVLRETLTPGGSGQCRLLNMLLQDGRQTACQVDYHQLLQYSSIRQAHRPASARVRPCRYDVQPRSSAHPSVS